MTTKEELINKAKMAEKAWKDASAAFKFQHGGLSTYLGGDAPGCSDFAERAVAKKLVDETLQNYISAMDELTRCHNPKYKVVFSENAYDQPHEMISIERIRKFLDKESIATQKESSCDISHGTTEDTRYAGAHVLAPRDKLVELSRVQRESQDQKPVNEACTFISESNDTTGTRLSECAKEFADILIRNRNLAIQKRAKFISQKNNEIIAETYKELANHFTESILPYVWSLEDHVKFFNIDHAAGDQQGLHNLSEFSSLLTQLHEALSDPRIVMTAESLATPTVDDYWEYEIEISLKDA